jgi:hypothetical protein
MSRGGSRGPDTPIATPRMSLPTGSPSANRSPSTGRKSITNSALSSPEKVYTLPPRRKSSIHAEGVYEEKDSYPDSELNGSGRAESNTHAPLTHVSLNLSRVPLARITSNMEYSEAHSEKFVLKRSNSDLDYSGVHIGQSFNFPSNEKDRAEEDYSDGPFPNRGQNRLSGKTGSGKNPLDLDRCPSTLGPISEIGTGMSGESSDTQDTKKASKESFPIGSNRASIEFSPSSTAGSNRASLEFPSLGSPLGGVLEGTLGEEVGGSLFNSPSQIKEQSESGKEDLGGILEESLEGSIGGVLGESLEESLGGVLGESLEESLVGGILDESLGGVLGENIGSLLNSPPPVNEKSEDSREDLGGDLGEDLEARYNIGPLLNSPPPVNRKSQPSTEYLGVGGTLSEDLRGCLLSSPPPVNVKSEKCTPLNGPPGPGTPDRPWEGMDALARLSQKGSDEKSRNGIFMLYIMYSTYIYVHAYSYLFTYIYIYVCICIYIYIYIYICIHIFIHTYTYISTYKNTYTHTYIGSFNGMVPFPGLTDLCSSPGVADLSSCLDLSTSLGDLSSSLGVMDLSFSSKITDLSLCLGHTPFSFPGVMNIDKEATIIRLNHILEGTQSAPIILDSRKSTASSTIKSSEGSSLKHSEHQDSSEYYTPSIKSESLFPDTDSRRGSSFRRGSSDSRNSVSTNHSRSSVRSRNFGSGSFSLSSSSSLQPGTKRVGSITPENSATGCLSQRDRSGKKRGGELGSSFEVPPEKALKTLDRVLKNALFENLPPIEFIRKVAAGEIGSEDSICDSDR